MVARARGGIAGYDDGGYVTSPQTLSASGIPVNDSTISLAYRFGAGGAHSLLTADPNAPVGSVLGPSVVKANPELAGQTVGQLLQSRGLRPQGDATMMATTTQPVPPGGLGQEVAYHPPSTSADPWKALTYAGLGILGGNSPQAGVNIGRGALSGLEAADREHQTDVQQAGTEAEREFSAQMQNRRQGETERHDTADEQSRAQQLAEEADRIREQMKHEDAQTDIERQRLATEQTHDQALENQGRWTSGMGPGENGQTVPGMYFVPKGGGQPVFHPGINTTQQQGIDLRNQALQETIKQHGIENDQKAQAAVQAQIGHMTEDGIRIYLGSKQTDLTGKTTFAMTPEQAEAEARKIRDGMGGQPSQQTQQTQQQPLTAPPPMNERVQGKAYPTPRGMMTWTGSGWVPAQ
jgi:septum formation inhibitor MinC